MIAFRPARLMAAAAWGFTPRDEQLNPAAAAGRAQQIAHAQSLERSTSTYAAFVRDAAAQARAANPRVAILAGLSTNPPGAEVTSQQLSAAIHATRGVVDGYWLNIPGRGPRCPTCNSPRPDVGQAALRAVL